MVQVSFVITVYNKAPFLPRVIQALKEQQGDFSREFIFVNDGSTDASLDVLKSETAALENVHILDQENQGVCKATNNGVRAAVGAFIKLVDGDDILAPYCTETLLNELHKNNVDFIFGNNEEYEETPTFKFDETAPTVIYEDPLFSVIDRGFARVSHCLFKKALFDHAGGCDERIFSQDHSLFIRLSSLGKLAQVKQTVCLSPKNEPGRIMNNNAQVIHDATIALAYHLLDGPNLSEKQKNAAQKKIAARIWKWAKKEHKEGFISPAFRTYLMTRLGCAPSAQRLIDLCDIFRKNATVRRP